jgi:hypothetical protein
VDPQEYQQLNFGGGVSRTFMSPVALLCIVIAGILVWRLPRSKAIVPFLAACLLIPTDQVLLLGSLHFPMLRVMALIGLSRVIWARVKARHKLFNNGMDTATVVFAVFTLVNGILLWRLPAQLIYQFGNLCDIFGLYLTIRYLIRDEQDVMRTMRALACIAAAIAAIMICEQATGKNPLYIALGGARATILGSVLSRDDSFRASGSFAHPILAGTFGGMMFPLFIGLWVKSKKDRKYAGTGIISTLIIPLAASSSTALFGLLGGILGLCFWPLRRRMRPIRWSIVLTLVSLHLVMKAPVWHLISRIDLTGSSSSYHRYQLVNQCILHFWDWVWIGTKDYGTWGWDMWDLSNQYAGTADTSGLIPLLAFLAILVFGFKYIGRARKAALSDKKKEFLVWTLGASLFANVVAFFGISYFDQTVVAWYSILAMISAMVASIQPARVPSREIDSTASARIFEPQFATSHLLAKPWAE